MMIAGRRLDLVVRTPDWSVEELREALIERLASSSEGPDVIEVGFLAESSSAWSGSTSGAGRH